MRKARRTTAAMERPTRAPKLRGEERREKERKRRERKKGGENESKEKGG